MNKNDHEPKNIDQEVQKTLKSLDGFEDIQADPYFQTRLIAQINDQEKAAEYWLAKLFLKGRLATSLLTAVIVLNVATVAVVLGDGSDTSSTDRQEYVETVADEYLLTSSSGWLDIELD